MLPWGLSMLWESSDSEQALRERFGFASLEAATHWVSDALASDWGIRAEGCVRLVISDRNAILWVASDCGDLVVKWSAAEEKFAQLDRSSRLLCDLVTSGLPVAMPVLTHGGQARKVLDGILGPLSVAVLPEIEGEWLDIGDGTAVRAAGACLAGLHLAMAALDCTQWGRADRQSLRTRIQAWLDSADRGFAPDSSRRLERLLARTPDLEGERQLVHNDFRAANILTRDSAIVGVLDFDDLLVDHRVSDIARASTYLGTRFTFWAPTPIIAQQQLRIGYESVQPLSPAESAWLEICTLWHGIAAIPSQDDPAGWAGAV